MCHEQDLARSPFDDDDASPHKLCERPDSRAPGKADSFLGSAGQLDRILSFAQQDHAIQLDQEPPSRPAQFPARQLTAAGMRDSGEGLA